MGIRSDVQGFAPGDDVYLYELDAERIGAGTYLFHGHAYRQPIYFGGVKYDPWPITATGFSKQGGKSAAPKLAIGNVEGVIGALVMAFDDLVGSQLTRRHTLSKYLDNGATPDPNEEYPREIWIVQQKVGHTKSSITFTLSSAIDFNGQELPGRQIIANMCPWGYRSADCGYNGPPVADEWDVITTDAARDKCGKHVSSCKLRFGEDGELSHGGFPAAGLVG